MAVLCYRRCLITTQKYTIKMVALGYIRVRYELISVHTGQYNDLFMQERDDIIERFREKKRRRVWKKKIRYHCRKNLADSRVRVKGRFVRRGSQISDGAPSPSGDGSIEEEDEEVVDDDDSDGEEAMSGDMDAATAVSAGDVTESGLKRSRGTDHAAEGTAKKQKKFRRVLFDKSAIDNSSSGSTPTTSAPEATGGTSQGGDNDEVYSRMRRHSIAY